MAGYWILDADKRPMKTDDMLVWGRFLKTNECIVKQEVIGESKISTVFLGIDHGWSEGPPVLFETMIFGGEHDGHQDRCSTWKQAEAMHETACAMVRGKQS